MFDLIFGERAARTFLELKNEMLTHVTEPEILDFVKTCTMMNIVCFLRFNHHDHLPRLECKYYIRENTDADYAKHVMYRKYDEINRVYHIPYTPKNHNGFVAKCHKIIPYELLGVLNQHVPDAASRLISRNLVYDNNYVTTHSAKYSRALGRLAPFMTKKFREIEKELHQANEIGGLYAGYELHTLQYPE